MIDPNEQRLPNGSNGRDNNGRFVRGCRPGPGNPMARRVAAIREAVLSAVTPADIRAQVKALKKACLSGDVQAIKLLWSYVLGKPADTLIVHDEADAAREAWRARVRAVLADPATHAAARALGQAAIDRLSQTPPAAGADGKLLQTPAE